MRGVVGGDGVHVAVGDADEQRGDVLAGSQRRIHFVIRVVADVFVAEREMVRRDFAGDAQAHLFREANIFERAGGGHVRDVQAGASERGEFDIASGANGFGLRGNAFQAEANGARAFAHDAAGEERRIFAVINHRQTERIAIIHHLAHEAGGGDGLAVVADGDDSGVFHGGDFREGFAFAADGGCADGPNADAARGGGAFDDSAGDGGIVIHRMGIGHAADGGEAAASGGARAGFDGLGHFLAGLAQVAVQVNESRRDDHAGGVENFCVGRGEIRADLGDASGVEEDILRGVGFARGIEDAAIFD